jgi:hypothetical protein
MQQQVNYLKLSFAGSEPSVIGNPTGFSGPLLSSVGYSTKQRSMPVSACFFYLWRS